MATSWSNDADSPLSEEEKKFLFHASRGCWLGVLYFIDLALIGIDLGKAAVIAIISTCCYFFSTGRRTVVCMSVVLTVYAIGVFVDFFPSIAEIKHAARYFFVEARGR